MSSSVSAVGSPKILRGMIGLDKKVSDIPICGLKKGSFSKEGKEGKVYPWGRNEVEPFVAVNVFSRQVKKADPLDTPYSWQTPPTERRSWHTKPPRGLPPFPRAVPLRLFINRDGSYKNSKDKVSIKWGEKMVTLICFHPKGKSQASGSSSDSDKSKKIVTRNFREGIGTRVQNSLNGGLFTQSELDRIKALAAKSGKWVDPEMGGPKPSKPVSHITELPEETIEKILTYLDPTTLSLIKRVSRFWNRLTSVENQHFWKSVCVGQGMSVDDSEVNRLVKEGLGSYSSQRSQGSFDGKIIALIIGYVLDLDYAQTALIPRGEIGIYSEQHYLKKQPKGGPNGYENWGIKDPEPFIQVEVFSASRMRQSWHRNPPRGIGVFPEWVPVRLFANEDGSCKNTGDRVYLIWKGRKVILTCAHKQEEWDSFCGRAITSKKVISSFREAIEARVEGSMSMRFVTEEDVSQGIRRAAAPGEWVDSQ